MSIRAVIFDVYGTLLEMGPPPANPEMGWGRLVREMLQVEPPLSWPEFSASCQQVIAKLHALARERGIAWPEVSWPSVVAEVLPEIQRLSAEQLEEFCFREIQLEHTTQLKSEAANTLRWLRERGCLLGLASNAQSYTGRELREGLQPYRLDLDVFEADLCFWSYLHGFSKPDPHVFQILALRLEERGIAPQETLMVGDYVENDLAPAKAFGWQTWQLIPTTSGTGCSRSGDWEQLARQFQEAWLLHGDLRVK